MSTHVLGRSLRLGVVFCGVVTALCGRSEAAVVSKVPAIFSRAAIPQTNRPFIVGVRPNIGTAALAVSTATSAVPVLVGFVESSPDLAGYPSLGDNGNALSLSVPDAYIPTSVSAINLTSEFDDLSYSGPFSVTFSIIGLKGAVVSPITMSGNITPFNYYASSGTIPRPAYSGPATVIFTYTYPGAKLTLPLVELVYFQ